MSAITSADGFHHLVYSISGTTHTLFLDGSAVSVNTNGTNVSSTFPNISNLFIGTAGDLSFGYTGYIDDFKVYNRALTITDATTIYNANVKISIVSFQIDKLSTAAYNQMVYAGTTLQAGAFGVKLLLSSAKSNPIIQIKAGTGGTPTDFYAPTDGTTNITTGPNGTGTGIIAFLGANIGYVTKWYDQTGNGHHATAQGATLPTFDKTTFVVDFGTTGYFSLADNSYPTGNLPYTYLYNQGRMDTTKVTVPYGGGSEATAQKVCVLLNYNSSNPTTYNEAWYACDAYNGPVSTPNAVHAFTYGGGGNNGGTTGKAVYINNVKNAFTSFYNNFNRNQTPYNCYLGYTIGYPTYNSTMSYFYWMPYQLSAPDIAILGATIVSFQINTLSTAAYNQMVYAGTTLQAGAFGVKLLLSSARTNPVIQIKAGTGGTPTDFYAPTDGTTNITTGANGTGIGIIAFLGANIGYVTKWYDQTGNGHHGTAGGATLPTFNTTTFVVDFGTNGFFSLADNSYPTGNLPYTYFYKQGTLPAYSSGSGNAVYFGGNPSTNSQLEMFVVNNAGTGYIADNWWNADGYNNTNVIQSNSVVAVTYGGGGNNFGTTGKLTYINNNQVSYTVNGSTGNRSQTSVNCYLGYASGYKTYQSSMSYFYWMPYQLSSADRIILGAT